MKAILEYFNVGVIVFIFLFSVSLNKIFPLSNSVFTINWLITAMAIIAVAAYSFTITRDIILPKSFFLYILLLSTVSVLSFFSDYSNSKLLWRLLFSTLFYLLLNKLYNNRLTVLLYFTLSIVGVSEALFGFSLISNSFLGMSGHFNNPVGFAVIISALLPFSFYLIKNINKPIAFFGIICSLVMFTAICYSKSRSGIIAAIICSITYFTFQYKQCLNRLSKKVKIISLLAALVAILFATYSLYISKKDSADGRLLIWNCSVNMIKDNLTFGHGTNSFDAKYMLYQAKYFEQNPKSKFVTLADSVRSPFNEYLSVLLQYGIFGFLIIFTLFAKIIISGIKNFSEEKFVSLISLLSIAIIALFSYPLYFPVTTLILTLNIYILSEDSKVIIPKVIEKTWFLSILIFICIFLVAHSIQDINNNKNWAKIKYSTSLIYIQQFEHLASSTKLGDNPFFLYNYAAILNKNKLYKRSNDVLAKCQIKLNDFDVAILMADNFFNLGDYRYAEKWALLASNMCPSRLVPLYYLVMVYSKTNRIEHAIELSHLILKKDIKIQTADAYKVKFLIENFLEENHALQLNSYSN